MSTGSTNLIAVSDKAVDGFVLEIRSRYAGKYKIVKRSESSWFWRALWFLIGLFNKRYASSYATTIAATTFVPENFGSWSPERRWSLLHHEAVHVVQAYSWPLGSWAGRFNIPLFSFAYLFLPLPFFYTLRAKFEREAYRESIAVAYLLGWLGSEEARGSYIKFLTDVFAGSGYLWMWRSSSAEKWVRATVEEARSGKLFPRWGF